MRYPAVMHAREIVLPLLLVASFVSGCVSVSGSTSQGSDAVTVTRRTVEDVFLLTGELAAVRSDELAVPRIENGRAQLKWLIEDGAEVEPGQAVAEIDNTQIAQALEEKRLRLAQAQIQIDGREASLEAEASQKRFDLERAQTEAAKARIEAGVPVELRSRKEWHEKQQALRKAETDLQKAELAMRAFGDSSASDVEVMRIARDKAGREVKAAEESLQQLSLVAPKKGIAILGRSNQEDRPLQVGDVVWPGMRVVSLPDLNAMEVIAFLPEVDDGRVTAGQEVRVFLETDLGRSFRGRIEKVAAVAQDARYAGGFRVKVSLEETDPTIMRPGLSARVEVVRRVFKDALIVPRKALVRKGSELHVRRAGGGSTPIRVSGCLPLECVVETGLSEGDRVALR
jgi:multidrug efflux pump subunit AcrA (membrane-fusion protein)